MAVCVCDADRVADLHLLAEQGQRCGLRFLSLCLMSTHVHLILMLETVGALARGIGEYGSAASPSTAKVLTGRPLGPPKRGRPRKESE